MVKIKKRKMEILDLLESISYDDYLHTNEVARKLDQNWATVLCKLLYLEYKGYVKFLEIRNNRGQYQGVSYVWKRLHDDEEKNTSLSSSFISLLDYLREDIFESTLQIGKRIKENQMILKSKLLYLRSRGYVVCFKMGRGDFNAAYYWKNLNEKERERNKDRNQEEVEQEYAAECFKYK